MLTSQDVATRLGVTDSMIRKLAARLGVGKKVARDWRFSERDVAKMQAARRPVGRPKAQ